MTIQQVAQQAYEAYGASLSDIHLRVGLAPHARQNGLLVALDAPVVSAQEIEDLCAVLVPASDREVLAQAGDLDVTVPVEGVGVLRVSMFRESGRPAVVARALPIATHTAESLGLPPIVADLCRRPNGLIVVGGPTGCGKTTSLAAMLEQINRESASHIVSLQGPVEVLFEPKKSLVTVREIGRDVPSFAQAARYALRHDPDVIHLAELRDLDTVALAMVLAETGHLVMTTMHTASAEESINRIVDVFSSERTVAIRRQLADVLCAVICQRLVLRADGRGRVPVCEVLVATPEVRQMIREGTPGLTGLIERSGDAGMQTMEQALARAVQAGLIAPDRA